MSKHGEAVIIHAPQQEVWDASMIQFGATFGLNDKESAITLYQDQELRRPVSLLGHVGLLTAVVTQFEPPEKLHVQIDSQLSSFPFLPRGLEFAVHNRPVAPGQEAVRLSARLDLDYPFYKTALYLPFGTSFCLQAKHHLQRIKSQLEHS